MQDIDPADIIVLDESGSDLRQTRDYARGQGGNRIKMAKPQNPGSRFSIIAAISTTEIVAAMYTDTAINAEIFEIFIEKMLLKNLRPGQYVVMDNINFHKRPIIIAI